MIWPPPDAPDLPLPSTSRPRLMAQLRWDQGREVWLLVAGEQMLQPDEVALEILRRCDGTRTLETLCEELSRQFDADREIIDQDVRELLADLAAQGLIAT